jgi:hypothetical protein
MQKLNNFWHVGYYYYVCSMSYSAIHYLDSYVIVVMIWHGEGVDTYVILIQNNVTASYSVHHVF